MLHLAQNRETIIYIPIGEHNLVTTIRTSYLQLPSDQSFLSNTASSNHEVFCVACQSHSWFVYAWRAHLEILFGNKQTKYATDKPLKQGHARKKPPLLAV